MPINAEWHKAHVMPKNATTDQRIAWHLEHAVECGCREITGKLAEEMRKRGIRVPEAKGARDKGIGG